MSTKQKVQAITRHWRTLRRQKAQMISNGIRARCYRINDAPAEAGAERLRQRIERLEKRYRFLAIQSGARGDQIGREHKRRAGALKQSLELRRASEGRLRQIGWSNEKARKALVQRASEACRQIDRLLDQALYSARLAGAKQQLRAGRGRMAA